jgi:hypothetical protein
MWSVAGSREITTSFYWISNPTYSLSFVASVRWVLKVGLSCWSFWSWEGSEEAIVKSTVGSDLKKWATA